MFRIKAHSNSCLRDNNRADVMRATDRGNLIAEEQLEDVHSREYLARDDEHVSCGDLAAQRERRIGQSFV